ncbi:tRNA preQ1(34) S-adenosylmethionine ribosyltransferase-isomerase QueA [Aphanothece hegewaldii CCALA 016]|uniref:S-adenosylmethionine:tRNA ribosyltransferase-isomerase n=1 Tax=Aphanothece hegewaldii CCALA 016 TaxID=2107694 RepID=A0A2T1LST1_9CHRO|nr:tRNA preQ1(34) S-adenosylmethionine ribosyltransferase-isomerase QueA [Aphanothece hegewaldii]PSF33112.1 tRNA preQ1(34) S-adenosylmethionine ribosyltransferase-isomerase QueA [Aphanothece hegewaldii CCALA 016]
MTSDQLLSGYDYTLPSELIAQNPVNPRDHSRLLIIDSLNTHKHGIFQDLTNWLLPGDLLVLNNTQVIPARLYGRKATGAPVEILLLEERINNCWLALVKPGKRFKIGSEVWFYPFNHPEQSESNILKAKVIDRDLATGGRLLQFQIPPHQSFLTLLEQFGQIPFPPYVTASEADPSQYQTVYAQELGSVAAPTAGLHFTEELLQKLQEMGVNLAYVTLHVGVGTFRPVEVEDITQHIMHQEWIELPQKTVDLIQETKAKGSRVIAVGTTATRTLEGAMKEIKAAGGDHLAAFRGKTDLFIYPGYQWQVIDGLITNFHLPKSSLLMLVSALIGRERLLALYAEAIKEKYRFYSFGDAMLILPSAVI